MIAVSMAAPCLRLADAAKFRAMSADPRPDELGTPVAATLGDLLYSHPGKVRIQEGEWTELLQAVAAGDQRALYSIYGRIHRIVFTSIVRIVKSRESAEELTVDVFHDVWKKAGSYDPAGGTVVGWIMNQARSRAIDRLRFETRKKRANPFLEPHSENVAGDAEEILRAEESARRLKGALGSLTAEERQAIETAFLSECTYVETAVLLKQPVGTVKTRIRSALAKLREKLGPGMGES